MSTVPPLPSLEHSFEPFKFDAAPLQKFMRAVWDKASDKFSACINWLALNSERVCILASQCTDTPERACAGGELRGQQQAADAGAARAEGEVLQRNIDLR